MSLLQQVHFWCDQFLKESAGEKRNHTVQSILVTQGRGPCWCVSIIGGNTGQLP